MPLLSLVFRSLLVLFFLFEAIGSECSLDHMSWRFHVGALCGWSHVHDDTLAIDHLVLPLFGPGLWLT